MFETITIWLTETISQLGYPGILLLMALESSFFPFPSEVVLPPAGYLAAQGRMNAWIALGAGIGGSLIGAIFNYYLALRLGRPILYGLLDRYRRILLIKRGAFEKSEAFFQGHGEITTFVGRLIPGIRQLISLPAGLARMNMARFAFFTGLGAGIWCAVLTYIGWVIGRQGDVLIQTMDEKVKEYSHVALVVILPLLIVLVAGYVIWVRRRRIAPSAVPEA